MGYCPLSSLFVLELCQQPMGHMGGGWSPRTMEGSGRGHPGGPAPWLWGLRGCLPQGLGPCYGSGPIAMGSLGRCPPLRVGEPATRQLLCLWELGTGTPHMGPALWPGWWHCCRGVQAGGPPPPWPGPTPPAAPPHSSASEPGWTPASAGGPHRRDRAGARPPGAGWGGNGGAPTATCAGCAVSPNMAPWPPHPAPGHAGGWGRAAVGRALALTAALSCLFSAIRVVAKPWGWQFGEGTRGGRGG